MAIRGQGIPGFHQENSYNLCTLSILPILDNNDVSVKIYLEVLS